MTDYNTAVASSTLSVSAGLRIMQSVKDELEKRKGAPLRKFFTKPAIAVILSLVFIAGIVSPIGIAFHDRTKDNPGDFSGGAVGPQELTPYFCAYKFDANVFDRDRVEVEIYLGISKSIFGECHFDDSGKIERWGEIIEFSIIPTIKNFEFIESYIQENKANSHFSEYYDFYHDLVANTSLLQYNNGLYIWDKISFDKFESFPFEEYEIDFYWEQNREQTIRRRVFTHSERVIIPAVFFEEESGAIIIDLEEYTKFENGHVEMRYTPYPQIEFSYHKRDGKIYIENKEGGLSQVIYEHKEGALY